MGRMRRPCVAGTKERRRLNGGSGRIGNRKGTAMGAHRGADNGGMEEDERLSGAGLHP